VGSSNHNAQGGYNVVFQGLAGDHASGQCEVFADGFAGAAESPDQAAHRPSGVRSDPTAHSTISDDVRGRIYRIVYRGGAGAEGRRGNHACPSAAAPAGNVSVDDAKPPEGTHPDAGDARCNREPSRSGGRDEGDGRAGVIAFTTAKSAVRPARVATGANANRHYIGSRLSPAHIGCGAMAVTQRLRK